MITPAAWGMFTRRLPPFDEPPRTPDEDREVLRAGLAELGAHAAAAGVSVFFEPLNRYEDHMVNTLAQGAALIDGLPGVRLLADTYHMNIEEDDLCAALRSVADVLGAVHLSDSNRAQPGTGHVPFAAVIATLREVGFDGVLSVECRLRGEPRRGRARVRGVPPRPARRLRRAAQGRVLLRLRSAQAQQHTSGGAPRGRLTRPPAAAGPACW